LLFVGFANKEFAEGYRFCLPLLQGTRDYSSVDARIRKGQVLGERLSGHVSQISAD